MRHEVPTVSPDDSVATVAMTMVEAGLPGVPVVEDGRIIGIVTEGDMVTREAEVELPARTSILDATLTLDAGRPYEDELRRVLAVTARELMTAPVFNILDRATVYELATLMQDENVNPVPVVNDDHQLVGIVSRTDLVRMIARLESGEVPDASVAG